MLPVYGYLPTRHPDSRTYGNFMWLIGRIRAGGADFPARVQQYRELSMAIMDSMPREWRCMVHEHGDGCIPLYLMGYPLNAAKAAAHAALRHADMQIIKAVDKRI